jgi:hypothetical protein
MNIRKVALALFSTILLGSFSLPTTEHNDIVSFRNDVYPIFQTKCNQGECHGRKGKAFPKYTSYAIIRAKSSKIVYRLNKEKDPMPPADAEIPLKPEEKKMILDWIKSGMPNN